MAKQRRRPLMVGNWKMNLNHLEAIALVQKLAFDLKENELDVVETVVLPPFTDIRSVQTLVDGDRIDIGYGAQDLSPHASGAHTGDVSGAMLAKLGCTYVTVGHSERRHDHGEDDATVAAKARAAYAHGMTPIVCVGEMEAVRDAGDQVPYTVEQLHGSLEGVTPEQAASLVVAYEPVWAIGTGRTATPDDAHEMARALRGALSDRFGAAVAESTRILYGGSVKPEIAAEVCCSPIDGGLVGGASLDAAAFAAIVRAALG